MVFFGLEGQVTRMWMEDLGGCKVYMGFLREWLVGGAGFVWTNDWLGENFSTETLRSRIRGQLLFSFVLLIRVYDELHEYALPHHVSVE